MLNSTADLTKLTIINSVMSSNLFFFAARNTTVWSNEASPPAASSLTVNDFNNEIVFLKQIAMSNVRFLVDRVNWVSGNKTVGTFIYAAPRIYYVTGSGTNTLVPVHLSGTTTSGGSATFEYVGSLTSYEISKYLSSSYLPLTIASEKFLFSTVTIRGIKIAVDIISDEEKNLPLTSKFRVYGVYANPPTRKFRVNLSSTPTATKALGKVLTFNTKVGQNRTADQIDTYIFDITL